MTNRELRILAHLGFSTAIYCLFVWWLAVHRESMAEYKNFHPYIAASILGVNVGIYAIVNGARDYGWGD